MYAQEVRGFEKGRFERIFFALCACGWCKGDGWDRTKSRVGKPRHGPSEKLGQLKKPVTYPAEDEDSLLLGSL